MAPPTLVNLKRLAQILGIPKRDVIRGIDSDIIPFIKIGNSYMFDWVLVESRITECAKRRKHEARITLFDEKPKNQVVD